MSREHNRVSLEQAKSYLRGEVQVKIDRPIGSKHPSHNYIYTVNYGFVPRTFAPDEGGIDVYYLGINQPISEADGICIAIVHRKDDNDDTLVVVPKGVKLTIEEIQKAVEFQEKFFDSEIILSTLSIKEIIDSDPDISYSLNKFTELLVRRDNGRQELAHAMEVCEFASLLLDQIQPLDPKKRKVVFISALLHDIGRYLEYTDIIQHTEIKSQHINDFLPPLEQEVKEDILRCIRRHSMASAEKCETVNEQIVFDADHLSIFTKFGYQRWFFKAEDWGGVQNVQEADESLEELYQRAENGGLFYLSESGSILHGTFYNSIRSRKI